MVAIGLQTYGDFQRVRGKSELAAPLYERALTILEARRGIEHFEILPTVAALGEAYTELGRYAEADQQFVRALQMSKDTYGPNHPDVAATLERYAVLQQKSGRPSRAAQTLQDAKRIRDLSERDPTGAPLQAGRY
jgi:tetratricopeptide (TPR) repeat protein